MSNSSQQKQKSEEEEIKIDLTFLDYIKKVMRPHQKEFNVVDLFEIVIDHCMKQSSRILESANQRSESLSFTQSLSQTQSIGIMNKEIIIPNLNHMRKRSSAQIELEIQQKKVQQAQKIIDKLKEIFLWYQKPTISFQMINNYVLSCQNNILKDKNSLDNLSQYQNLPERRVRLDENVKLCIMPQGDSSRIKFISMNPTDYNDEDIFRKQIFVVTSEYIRSLKIDSEKLAKQGNKTVKIQQNQHEKKNKISIIKNWYTYSDQKIIPEIIQDNSQNMKISAKKQLYIEKVAMSQNIVGIITYERQIIIKPILKSHEKHQRGRTVIPYQIKLGNMVSDVPDQNLQKPLKKDKSKALQIQKSKILLFECYNDDVWIAVNQHFVYVYVLPLSVTNQLVNDELERSSMLSLCEPFPVRAQQAQLLTKQYMAIMLEDSCILILKLQLSSKKEERHKNRIYPTNKIYNDIKFICMDYHPVEKQLVLTDQGSYLIRLKFNITNGDIQRQGPVYDAKTGKFLTENTTNTKRDKQFSNCRIQSQIKGQSLTNVLNLGTNTQHNASLNKQTTTGAKMNNQTFTIWQNKGKSIDYKTLSQVNIGNMKQSKNPQKKDKSGKSLFAKPQNTDFIKIVKNCSRQNMILICLNKNTSTLITYEQVSVNPLKNRSDESQQPNADRLYDKAIKLWDLHYMNVYQTFTLSLQIINLSLQSNGLYIVTKDRGYLGFYPLLNKEQQKKQNSLPVSSQNKNKAEKTKLGQKIFISGNELFFYTELPKQRNNIKIEQPQYQNHLLNYNNPVTTIYNLSFSKPQKLIQNLEEIPAQITQMDVQNKIYVLCDTSGDKKHNLHVYDILGNKEVTMKATQRTQKFSIIENYSNIAKIKHFQFNVLLWNKRSLKFLGSNMEQSFTIHWTFSCHQKGSNIEASQFDMRSLKSSSKKQKAIEEICISQNSFTVLEKHQNDLLRNVTLTIVGIESARIKYRIHDVKSSIKVLQNFNSMLLAQESYYKYKVNSQQDHFTERRSLSQSVKSSIINEQEITYPTDENQVFINLFDLNSPFHRKCLFSIKFHNLVQRNMTLPQIKKHGTNYNDAIFFDKFFVQHFINLKSAQIFSLNKDESIVISCIFHLKTQWIIKDSEPSTSVNQKVMSSEEKHFLYTRQVASEIAQRLNYIPRTIDTNVKKKSKKVEFQYVGESDVHDRILGHWEIDLDELITRSTIKNFNYLNDLHARTDEDLEWIIHDVTDKLIKFSQNQQKYQYLFEETQKISKIYDNSSQSLGKKVKDLKASWILAEAESFKSILCLNSQYFLEIYTQQISFDSKAKEKLKVTLEKICRIEIDAEIDKPILRLWNKSFNEQKKKMWQETKSDMIEYMRKKMSHQNSKKQSILKKLNIKEQRPQALTQRHQQSGFITQQNSLSRRKAMSSLKNYENKFSSNQINNIFRQWTINKNIEKQMKIYQKTNTDTQQILNKQLKIVIQNPQLKQERIQYLLQFPQKIKDLNTPFKVKPLAKKDQQRNQIIDVKAILNSNQNEQSSEGNTFQSPKKIKTKRTREIVDDKVCGQLDKLDKSMVFVSTQHQTIQKTLPSSTTDKLSELKLTQKLSCKTKLVSPFSLSPQTNKFQRSDSIKTNLPHSIRTLNSPIQRTKTQTIEKNYIQLIAQTSLESLKSMSKHRTKQKVHKKVQSPNPESSLSNIRIKKSLSKQQNSNQNDLSKILLRKSQITEFDCIPVKKNSSILTRCKTQISNHDEDLTNLSKIALMQLKQSAKAINQSVLPQIKINRQKLNEKMKEKKSFLKSINEILGPYKQEIKNQVFKKQLNSSLIKLSPIT